MGRHEGWRPVPGWFRRVLHLVIYAEGRGGYLATQALSAAMAAFIANGGAAEPNVRIVVDRLAPLSAVELGVLCAVLLRRRKGETLSRLGIGHAWYHVVKARVEAMFQLSGPPAKKCEKATMQAGLRFGIIEAMTKSTKSLAVAALAIAGALASPLRSDVALDSITPPTVQS